MEIVIVTGLSGAGKSKAVDSLEDIGYFCIDNMPPTLIPTFAQLAVQSNNVDKIAVVTDVRAKDFFGGIFDCIKKLKRAKINYKILFLDAEQDVLAKRFKETRRKHPLSQGEEISTEDAIIKEREMLAPIFEAADFVIDTSYMSVATLRERVLALFGGSASRQFRVLAISFGFKYGLPTEADLVFDVRCLDNPFYVDELKAKTGLDPEVRDYVMKSKATQDYLKACDAFIETALPMYVSEGKAELVIAVGCTGGKHRSVVVCEHLCELAARAGYTAHSVHRDIDKVV